MAGIPAAMIFVRSAGGRSHCPEEFSTAQDLAAGVRKLAPTLQRIERVSRPRLPWLFGPVGDRMIGLSCFLPSLVLLVPGGREVFDWLGHGFVKKTNADYQFAATILFLRTHLLD